MEEKTGCVRRALQARKAVSKILYAADQLAGNSDQDVSRLAKVIITAAKSLEE